MFVRRSLFALALVIALPLASQADFRNGSNYYPIFAGPSPANDPEAYFPVYGGPVPAARSDADNFYPIFGGPLPGTPRNLTFINAEAVRVANLRPVELPGGLTSRLTVIVPADAVITLNGEKVAAERATARRFVTPPLREGQRYAYDVKAVWVEKGKAITRMQRVQFKAGAEVVVNLVVPPKP